MNAWIWHPGSVVLFLLVSGLSFGEPVVRNIHVNSENRDGKVWTNLSGEVEVWTDLPVDRLLAVITDWPSYPRIFSRIKKAESQGTGAEFLLDEVVTVSIFGIPVTNKFTLKVQVGEGDVPGSAFVRWTQDHTDGTIDLLVGGWTLTPQTSNGRSGTLIKYQNASSVVQSLPGQDFVVRMFLPGELRDVVSAAVAEARKKKEGP